jgi:hypothetical protein
VTLRTGPRESARWFEGNGAGLVRERALAMAVQAGLERLYQIERVADVSAFVSAAEDGEREVLLVRTADDGAVEMSLRLPLLGEPAFDILHDGSLDPLCQIIEGVSHFVYLATRARQDRTATQLELELQAEVDKYVVLVAALGDPDETKSARLRARLYEQVSYSDAAGSEVGDRYRMANRVASRFVRHLEQSFVKRGRVRELWGELRRFYRLGQEDKLRAVATT